VHTGLDIGADPGALERVLREVIPRTCKPLIVKLTPNAADVPACAQAAQAAGAHAVSLINTLRAMALYPGRRSGSPRPWLGAGSGGLSGPAIRSVALAQVAAVAARVSIPIVGMGGVQSTAHARELLDAGATLVGIGTANFSDPTLAAHIADELTCQTNHARQPR
jgi:dihydroorotate dehydrogenase (NAD+) catalytic subunit